MIAERDRYHGVVLRQIVVDHGGPLRIGVADSHGRDDVFFVENGAFQIKHSSKRLSPWRFTYLPEHFRELAALRGRFDRVWAILVCGSDGIVGLSYEELKSIVDVNSDTATWVRVSRSRNSMYRVGGGLGELSRAVPRGVQLFLDGLSSATVPPGNP